MPYKPRKRTADSESVFLNGIEFRRYPKSKQWSDRVYYKPGGSDAERGVEVYHRELWKFYRGPIPEDCDIHHRDNNPLNNDIENLECLPGSEHQSKHGDKTKSSEYLEARRANMGKAREAAAEWHGSKEGRKWHSKHAVEFWKGKEPATLICDNCGKSFQTIAQHSNTRFCSSSCKSAYRRKSGVDRETRVCEYCGKPFQTNRFLSTRFCSLSCGALARYKK